MDLDGLEALAGKPENTMMILCSPHNPVGRVWKAEELKPVAEICARNGVLLISDEIHCDLTRKAHSVITTLDPSYKDNTVVCLSTAKTFNMAGFTAANIVIENDGLRKRFQKRRDTEASGGMTFFARIATIAAYTHCDYWVDGVNAYIDGNYNTLKGFADKHKDQGLRLTEMEGTYLAWLDMSGLGLSDEGLENFMNEKALMSIDPGHWFGEGGSGFIRINIAAPRAALEEALERFGAALNDL
jgi:cystathionine beta-lyase